MKTNEHSFDRIFRIILGIGLLALINNGPHTPWGWIGIIPFATGVFGFCPLYRVLGISTCKSN